ncbi:MAG: CcmD family protein [Flavisolibacter sp.]|nr:CcmD family protein [Flavisolibacter sp.]
MIRKIYATILLMFISFTAMAQGSNRQTEMADLMRSNGKIYVVTAVIITIFAGIIIYLIRIERKMNRLEK